MSYFGLALESLELKLADNTWTNERIALLREYYPKMRSRDVADRISRETGLSMNKNQIIGKAGRMGLQSFKPQAASVPKGSRQQRGPRRYRILRQNAQATARTSREAIMSAAEPSVEHRKTIFELGNHDCRWIYGEPKVNPFYCGMPEADLDERRPYCNFHHAIAFQHRAA